MRIQLALFAGCTLSTTNPTAPDAGAPPPPTGPDTGAPVADDLLEFLPSAWSAAPGWAIEQVRVVGDLDLDGRTDATIELSSVAAPWDTWTTLIVYGPLTESDGLGPSVAADVQTGWGGPSFLHADDDGIVDMFIGNGYQDAVVRGPVVGAVRPAEDGTAVRYERLLDLDLDGVVDKVAFIYESDTQPTLHVTFGPFTRWDADADLVIAPSCEGDEKDFWWNGLLQRWPDVTGDGAPELLVGMMGWGCGPWLTEQLPTGRWDPTTDPQTRRLRSEPPLSIVPDQTGDGRDDVLVSSVDRARILAYPISISDWGTATSDNETLAPAGLRLHPTDYDFDDDGVADFLALARADDGYAVSIHPGGPRLSEGTPIVSDEAWIVPSAQAPALYVVEGTAFLITSPAGTPDEPVTTVQHHVLGPVDALR